MLKLALPFQDHMILQREKRIVIWGMSENDAAVSVAIQDHWETVKADENGCWRLEIGPLHTSFKESMTISFGEETIELQDIQVGDVYLAAGQSNMEFHMRYDTDFSQEKKACFNENLRFFDYPKVTYPGQIHEADYGKNYAFWRKATPDNLEWFPAAGYYFAKEIQEKYQIPVGIVGCNFGGSPACCWMDEQTLLEGGGQAYLDDYSKATSGMDSDAYDAVFRQSPSSWRTDPFASPLADLMMQGMSLPEILQKLYGDELDPSKFDFLLEAPPMGPKHQWRPCGLYESMLCEVAPYGIRGILFYQGESDGDQHPETYITLFPALIRCFRRLWNEELPFLFVQLAPFGHWMQSVGEPYAIIREAQQTVSETVPGTAMAVISDVGMEQDIHPKKKQPVGHRLALLAEKMIYGEDILCEAPAMVCAEVEHGKLKLRFAHTGSGLWLADHTPDNAPTDPERMEALKILSDGEPVDLSCVTAKASGDAVELDGISFHGGMTVELGIGGWYRINLYNSADIPARPARVTVADLS